MYQKINNQKDTYRQKAYNLLQEPPMAWQELTEKMTKDEQEIIRQYLEAIALKAGQLAGYIDMRHGFGCGDQGHIAGVQQLNTNGRRIHCNVFGYNAYHKLII